MPDIDKKREQLERLAEICLALSSAMREDKGSHAIFRVAKKSSPTTWTIITATES